jgi:hypothetical protein
MMIKSLLSFVVFFSFACTCFGQIENRATLQYLFYNPTNDQNSKNVNQSNVELNYFLKSKKIFKKVRWDNSFGYKTLFLDQGINQNLQDVSYTSNFIYTKNLKNFLLFNARINVRSELQTDISGKSIFPAFSFGYMRQSQKNKAIRWGIGVNYNNDFNKNTIIPFALFNYETSKLKFNATLPNSVLFLVKHKPNFNYGATATLNASIYNLPNENAEYLKLFNTNFFGFIQTKVYNKLWLDVKPGITIMRNIDALQSNFDLVSSDSENKLSNNFVLNVGLLYRM